VHHHPTSHTFMQTHPNQT